MLEMELKAKLSNKEKCIKELELRGCEWRRDNVQEDTIYIQHQSEKAIDIPVFRIRKIDNKTILTLKVQAEDLNTARELELEVGDDKVMHQILQTIGFVAKVEVKKRRLETECEGYTICIDEVERLGDFIEIEKIGSEESDRDTEYQKMMCILKELGIREENLMTKKYFEMIQELGLKKETR